MATDWPGVPSWYRNIALPVSCDCDRMYTPNMRAPWIYDSEGFPVTQVAWWDFIEGANRLVPAFDLSLCEFGASSFDPFQNELRAIRLLLTRDFSSPFTMLASLFLLHDTMFSQQRVVNQVNLTNLHGAYLPRGVSITFPFNGWLPVFQTFPPAALPNTTVSCAPTNCAHGWKWGEPLPDA